MDGASTPGQARAYWITNYAFEPSGGGLGVSLSCTTSSSRVALVGKGNSFVINNSGTEWANILFGGSDVEATLACFAIPPGTQITLSGPADTVRDGDWTHVAGITATGTTTIQITRGFGI